MRRNYPFQFLSQIVCELQRKETRPLRPQIQRKHLGESLLKKKIKPGFKI